MYAIPVYAGIINFTDNGGDKTVRIMQIQSSDRAQYAINDIIQGQNIDINNYKNKKYLS